MKILVTGGAGFIGSWVVDQYIAEGHNVVILDDLSSGKLENINPKAKFYKMDIKDKHFKEMLEHIFKVEKPDVVNHHAAHISVRESVKDPIYDAETNIIGTLNLLENCVRFEVQKFIFASSGGALYGESFLPSKEGDQIYPISPYGASKAAVEVYLNYFRRIKGLNCVSLRYANVYGPRQNPDGEAGVIAIFIKKMFSNSLVTVNGDGHQTRDYVYVEDVAKANSLALNDFIFGPFNIGTGIETNVINLKNILAEIIGISLLATCPGPEIPGEQKRSVLNCSKAKVCLNWNPTVSLEDGLKKTVDYFISMKGEGGL